MRPFFARAAALPASEAAFRERYGTFADTEAVRRFVSALREVAEVGEELGDPDATKRRMAEDGAYLLRSEPPGEVYAALMWLAMQVEHAAHSLGEGTTALRGPLTAGAGRS